MDLKQFDILLHDTEIQLKRLKALYEQWFQGIERLEPTVPRKELDRAFVVLNKEKPRNTAARFKLNTLQARYNTYTTYWQRIARQIEEGTYERDVRRARRRRNVGTSDEPAEVKTFELDESQSFDPDSLFADDEISSVLTALDKGTERPPTHTPRRGLSSFSGLLGPKGGSDSLPPLDGEDTAPNAINPFAKAPATATFGRPKSQPPPKPSFRPPTPESGSRRIPPPPPPPQARNAAAPPPRPAAPPPPPKADPMKRLYDDFVAARRQNNVSGSLSYDKLASRVESMKSKLREKHGNRNIDFEVVVKDGKVGLKPKIK
ncbi:MAG: hypothetical protein H6719_30490 [Sandaracinaceae bacterium]|nr:hypothetical protein [Sandaracinaceae bacterium]